MAFLNFARKAVEKYTPQRIKPFQRVILRFIFSVFYDHDLIILARFFGTDKWGDHRYCTHYQKIFSPLRHKRLNILEIGVGGFKDPDKGGSSLRMWKTYFPRSHIYAIDIYNKKGVEEKRIKIFQGSQDDPIFLRDVVHSIKGGIDIIIDDGSHMNEHIITSFKVLFPLLNDGGIYVAEDLETSYWPPWGGSSEDLAHSNSAMNYFKSLTDGLNHKEFLTPGYSPTYFDESITSIHFYHSLAFIFKGTNNERSMRSVFNC